MPAKAYLATVAVLAVLMANTAADAPLIIGILEERPSGDWGASLS
mgnify:CR=1 FL=1